MSTKEWEGRAGSESADTASSQLRQDVDALKIETILGHKQELRRTFDLVSLTGLGFIIAK